MTTRYWHYSKEPLRRVLPAPEQPAPGECRPGVGAGKPVGLWFSVGDAWRKWCRENDYETDGGVAVRTELSLDPGRFLVIDGYGKLMDFDREWSAPTGSGMSSCRIDWRGVAARWGGIVIAPYVWEARYELLWYYGWDCASGCVWDEGAASVIGGQAIMAHENLQVADGRDGEALPAPTRGVVRRGGAAQPSRGLARHARL